MVPTRATKHVMMQSVSAGARGCFCRWVIDSRPKCWRFRLFCSSSAPLSHEAQRNTLLTSPFVIEQLKLDRVTQRPSVVH